MKLLKLQAEPLAVADLTERLVSGPEVGGVATFLGVVKGITERGKVNGIEFTTDEAMASEQLEQLADEALRRFELSSVIMVHRLGTLEVGEPIVFIGTGAPHRGQALPACSWLIEQLKVQVPIWKAELTLEGRRWVVPHARGRSIEEAN